MEEHDSHLDGSVECLSHWIEALVKEKKVLEGRVEDQHRQLEAEEIRRKTMEDNMMWLLQKGVVRVVDKVVESVEFLIGVRQMKAGCMLVSVEGGKQEMR